MTSRVSQLSPQRPVNSCPTSPKAIPPAVRVPSMSHHRQSVDERIQQKMPLESSELLQHQSQSLAQQQFPIVSIHNPLLLLPACLCAPPSPAPTSSAPELSFRSPSRHELVRHTAAPGYLRTKRVLRTHRERTNSRSPFFD